MSRYTRQFHAAVIPASMLIFFSAGCAKEPATTMALAPSPGGAAGASASSSDEGGGQVSGVVGGGGRGVMGAGGGAQGVGGAAGGEDVGAGVGRSDFAAGGGGAAGSSLAKGGAAGGASNVARGGAGGGASSLAQSGSQLVAAARPQPKEFGGATGLQDIHFDFDKYVIRPEDAELLSADADWLREHPRAVILIEGHCDDRGTNEYNLALGNHRAESALKFLLSRGIARSRMSTLSYGEERPLCTEETEECWAQNRRAHFLVKHQ
jgi:peptidoglycan-associated lipoprotein